MGFRFYRRLKIAPGITLNFSKTGVSTSFGPRGAKVTVGRNGVRKTVGIPGTGMYYTDYTPWKKSAEPSSRPTSYVPARETPETSSRREAPARTPVRTSSPPPPPPPPEKKPTVSEAEKKLTLSFLDRIFMPTAEVHLIDGLKSFISGDYSAALKHLEKNISLPDSAFFAGFILLSQRKFDASISAFKSALAESDGLGRSFAKIGVSIHFRIPITDSVELHISKPDKRSALFALCEAYQGAHKYQEAVDTLVELTKISPEYNCSKSDQPFRSFFSWFPPENEPKLLLQPCMTAPQSVQGDNIIQIIKTAMQAREQKIREELKLFAAGVEGYSLHN